MKKLLIILILMPFLAKAQDSSAVNCKILRETDPFTKATRISTGFIKLDGGSVSIDADQYEIDVLFNISGTDKCYDNNSTAWIFFEGVKTKLTSRNGGTMNCEGLFHFIFKNTPSLPTVLTRLMTQRTDYITFTGNNKVESKVKVKEEQRAILMEKITCLVNEAKLLIK
jgi:hypothetical protein